jgi:nitrite reductase/ring-hydroxylating ferredoxin subunit
MTGPVRLCAIEDIPEPGARGFVLGSGTDRRDVLVVRADGAVRAYENACPHQGTPLETFPDRFLTPEGDLIVCSTHGARFRVDDGICVSGPCKGEPLPPVSIRIEGGDIVLVDKSAN